MHGPDRAAGSSPFETAASRPPQGDGSIATNHEEQERTHPVKDNDNLTIERPTFVTHLECAMEGDHYPADQIHNLSKAGKPLLVRYDLAGVKKALTKDALAQRPADMWRYREMLPVRKCADIVSLGEVTTPLIRLPKLAARNSAAARSS